MKISVTLLALALAAQASGQVRISQVYGGGGNSGAQLKNDFVELFNAGGGAANLAGWSVQYASSAGPSWQTTPLSGTLQPGQYLLVRMAQGSGGTVDLPTPDVLGSIAMSAISGKVALVNGTATLSGACPSGGPVVDFVGFGAANCSETSPTPALSNTTAAIRNSGGCQDNNNNAADFTVGTPSPRNSASTRNPCSAPLSISTASPLPAGLAGAFYSQTFTLAGGTGPYTWTFTGTLPPGLAATGDRLSGVAASAGTFTFTARVTDSTGAFAEREFTLTIDPFTCNPTDSIAGVQGRAGVSPRTGAAVTVEGVVTALRSNGFFLQMPGAGDNDPATSDGIFVFTSSAPPPNATVGDGVCVAGPVEEFRTLTEINRPTAVVRLTTGNPLPEPVAMTQNACPASGFDTWECLESMRVAAAQLTVVGPTEGSVNRNAATATSNGLFWAVLAGTPRPFREPGVSILDTLPALAPCCIPRFDENPERFRVDSDGLLGAPRLDVTSYTALSNVLGVLSAEFSLYTLLPAPGAVVSGGMTAVAVPEPEERELTVAGLNLERFYDTERGGNDVLTPDAFARRLNKASLAIRNVLRSPDVVGVAEVENLATLRALAEKLNADAIAAGSANPKYEAYLEEGNDPGGIDVGFLVKGSRVRVDDVEQVGKEATFINPANGQTEELNDRPPLVLRARPDLGPGSNAFPFTVVMNHLRSLIGVNDPADGERVRAKRRAQAEFLASYLDSLHKGGTDVIVLGDFNAFEFSDGYVDVMGTVAGTPAPPDQVVLASQDLVQPDYENLVFRLPQQERYSYVFDGNAQVLDHALVNHRVSGRVSRFAYGRFDADFPEVLRTDATRPERVSDHDAPVVYIRLPRATEVAQQ